MTQMIKTLNLFILLSLFFVQANASEVTLKSDKHKSAEKNQFILKEVAEYLSIGEVELAYQLVEKHYQLSDLVALKYAQLSLITGRQQQAQALFKTLKASDQLSSSQKQNMQRFIQRFNLALKKKFSLAIKMVKQSQCIQAIQVLNSLLIFEQWQDKALKQLELCQVTELNNRLVLGYRLGWDDNIALTNEQLEQNSNKLLTASYQTGNLFMSSSVKLTKNHDLVKTLGLDAIKLTPSYYFSIRQYDDQITSQYDQSSHKLQFSASANNWRGLDVSLPVYFRYSQYDGRHYSNSFGSKLQFTRASNRSRQQFMLHWRAKTYAESGLQNKDGKLLELGYSYRYRFSSIRAQARFFWQEFRGPNDPSDEYQQAIMAIKLNQPFRLTALYNSTMDIFSGLKLKYKNYQGVDMDLESLYGEDYSQKRQDFRQNWQAGLGLSKGAWRFKTSVHYQRRNSNLELFDFKRKKVELGLQYVF